MAPQYGLGGIGWTDCANDPYFLATLQSYNPNFRASQGAVSGYNATALAALQQAAQAQASGSGTTSTSSSGVTAPKIDYATTKPESSGAGAWIAGATGAAALVVGAAAIKHGSVSKGMEAIGKFFTGKASEEVSKVADGATTKITAIRGSDGVMRYLLPGKTKGKEGDLAAIEKFAKEMGMKDVATAERQAFNPAESVVQSFNHSGFTIFAENGQVVKIEQAGKDVTSLFTAAEATEDYKKSLTVFENILKELGKKEDVNKTVFDNVTNIRYSNTFGDDVLEMTLAGYGKDPVIKKFTTLERFTIDSPEVKKLKLSESERAMFSEDFIAGKLCDNAQVGRWTRTMPDGTVLKFNGNKLESIVQGAEEYEEGTLEFIKYLEQKHGTIKKKTNQRVVDDYISAVFDKKEIPYDTPITI